MLDNSVESGGYASSSEIVRDALRQWEQREEVRKMERTRFKNAYDEGMASGEGRSVTADTLLAELKEETRTDG